MTHRRVLARCCARRAQHHAEVHDGIDGSGRFEPRGCVQRRIEICRFLDRYLAALEQVEPKLTQSSGRDIAEVMQVPRLAKSFDRSTQCARLPAIRSRGLWVSATNPCALLSGRPQRNGRLPGS